MPHNLHKGSRFLADYTGIVDGLCAVNPDAAERFCQSVERALKLLHQHPQLGAKAGYAHAPRVRKWVLRPYSNYLLFYLEDDREVRMLRLLHGAQDLPAIIFDE